jgi:hypothetical protein
MYISVCMCVRASEFVHEYAFALSHINNTQDVNYTNDWIHLFHSECAAFARLTLYIQYTLQPVYILCPV